MAGPSISDDGRYVAFDSEASNLVPLDTNGTADVFVRDRLARTTVRVSVASDGTQASGTEGTISGDGNRVAFSSFSDNLVPGDTNFAEDVFVHDRSNGTTVRASVASNGTGGDNSSFHPDLDQDGRLVAFDSFATNLVPNDTDDAIDVFVHNLARGKTGGITVQSAPSQVVNHASQGNISADGRFVAFTTAETTFFPDGNGPVQDVALFDRAKETFEVLSLNDSGRQGNDNSSAPVVNADGRFVAFTSFASNLVRNDTNFRDDVFVRARQFETTARVSVGSNGEEGDLDSLTGAINADGQVVALWSRATTFVPESGQPFFAYDIFVRDAHRAADLALALSDSPDPVALHGTVTYMAKITNSGPAGATGVTLAIDLGPRARVLSVSGASCTRGRGGLTCDVGELAPDTTATVTIRVRPNAAGTLSLTGKAYADQPDPNREDNAARETTTVTP